MEPHVTTLCRATHTLAAPDTKVAAFHKDTSLHLDIALQHGHDDKGCPAALFEKKTKPGMLGEGLVARLDIHEGEAISFVLRDQVPDHGGKDNILGLG